MWKLRIKIEARDKLIYESEICINELCTLDISRIDLQIKVTTLTKKELEEVNLKLLQHLGL